MVDAEHHFATMGGVEDIEVYPGVAEGSRLLFQLTGTILRLEGLPADEDDVARYMPADLMPKFDG